MCGTIEPCSFVPFCAIIVFVAEQSLGECLWHQRNRARCKKARPTRPRHPKSRHQASAPAHRRGRVGKRARRGDAVAEAQTARRNRASPKTLVHKTQKRRRQRRAQRSRARKKLAPPAKRRRLPSHAQRVSPAHRASPASEESPARRVSPVRKASHGQRASNARKASPDQRTRNVRRASPARKKSAGQKPITARTSSVNRKLSVAARHKA